MKKIGVLLLAVIMVFSLVACQTETPSTSESTAPSDDSSTVADDTTAEVSTDVSLDLSGKTLGFINAGPDDYYAAFGNALKALAEVYGIEVIELNSNYSSEQELANCQDLIMKGVDAIACITAGAAGSAATIQLANEAEVPIFFIVGQPETAEGSEYQGWVSDSYAMIGYAVGQWVAENYPDAKDKIVMIPGYFGQGTAEAEIVGFQLALDEAGLGEAYITASSEWQATKTLPIVQDLVASGRDFDVIFACNEETARGVIQVFEEQNVTDKALVSINGKEEGWQWMIDGTMMATGMDCPSLDADLSLQQIICYWSGEDYVKDLQIKPTTVLTKDNLEKAIPYVIEDYLTAREAGTFEYELSYYEEQYEANKDLFAEFDAKVAEYMAE